MRAKIQCRNMSLGDYDLSVASYLYNQFSFFFRDFILFFKFKFCFIDKQNTLHKTNTLILTTEIIFKKTTENNVNKDNGKKKKQIEIQKKN